MRYIKKINEFFDTEEIKSSMEVPFLQGKIPFKEIVKDKHILKLEDPLLHNLQSNCPYINSLGIKRDGQLLTIGFNKDLNFGKNNSVFIYFLIEVMEHNPTKRYACNIYTKCIGNNQILFEEKLNKPIIPFDELVKVVNINGLNMLISLNKFTNSSFNFKYANIDNRLDASRNLMSN